MGAIGQNLRVSETLARMTPTPQDMVRLAEFQTPGLRGVLIRGSHGGWGDESGSSRGLSGDIDLQWMLANRAAADAVIVSAKTAVRENYKPLALRPDFALARKELGLSGTPALIIATRTASAIPQALEIADAVVTCGESSNDARVIVAGMHDIDWPTAIRQLNELGYVRLVCEGGPSLLDALAASNCLDQMALTTSPLPSAAPSKSDALESFLSTRASQGLFKVAGFSFEMFGQLPAWSQKLTREEMFVLRQHGTEPAFSVDYEKKPAPGYYVCRACGNRLFDATDQFDARCGWPAFWQPSSDDKVRLIEDRSFGMRRVEVRCKGCDSHLGHVFHGEGFGFPTDARYCINAICLERRY